jgi:hypothetical protein
MKIQNQFPWERPRWKFFLSRIIVTRWMALWNNLFFTLNCFLLRHYSIASGEITTERVETHFLIIHFLLYKKQTIIASLSLTLSSHTISSPLRRNVNKLNSYTTTMAATSGEFTNFKCILTASLSLSFLLARLACVCIKKKRRREINFIIKLFIFHTLSIFKFSRREV